MALITDMGVLDGVGNGIIMPMLKNKWRVDFFNIGGFRDSGTYNNDTDILTLQAITGDRPKLTFEEITLDRYNSRGWIAGKHTWEPVTFTFESDISGRVAQVLQDQIEKQQNIIGRGHGRVFNSATSASQYKFGMLVSMLDGDITPLEQWAYDGCWIQTVDYGDLDYAASEAVKLPVTFRYDNARQVILPKTGNATGGSAGHTPFDA